MLTRRQFLAACGALPAAGLSASPAFAHDPRLLEDILYGVSDALIRGYIRDHYGEGRWDGNHWWYDGRRYSIIEYRNLLIDRYSHHRRFRPREVYDHNPPHRPESHRDHRPPRRPEHRDFRDHEPRPMPHREPRPGGKHEGGHGSR